MQSALGRIMVREGGRGCGEEGEGGRPALWTQRHHTAPCAMSSLCPPSPLLRLLPPALQVGRTSVVVAHRLSTIRNADLIALVFRGAILEQVSAEGGGGDGGGERCTPAMTLQDSLDASFP